MKILIRADSSVGLGMGHVMRCLTLADTLRERGAAVAFACRDLPGNLNDFISRQGYPLHVLSLDEGADWQADLEQTCGVLAKLGSPADWLVVDHYQLDAAWESGVRADVRKILAIDDLANRPHDCDLLLDQNCYPDQGVRYEKLLPSSCKRLLGPSYALLRREFADQRRHLRRRDGTVGSILIFFGGSDPTNETSKTLLGLNRWLPPEIAVDVVVGASNPHKAEVEALTVKMPNAAFHCQVSCMAELMARADVAIGAGGSAGWERLALGLPALVISVAPNQEEIARHLGILGAQQYLGRSEDVSGEDTLRALAQLMADRDRMLRMSALGRSLVDGLGVKRVADAMADAVSQTGITLRPATLADERNLFEWRNGPETRRYSLDPREIGWDEHVRWFRNSLNRPDRHILIGELERQPVGVLRYDVAGEGAEISVYLVPGHAGRGLGTALVKAGTDWVAGNLREVASLRARILPENVASQKAFAKAGYVESGDVFEYHISSCKSAQK
jgi:UDP-2,4-diacetamido-2,4,6-trideoxy-beta-L-altropyranose hydrolase